MEKDGAAFKVNSFEIINGITITGALFGGLKPKSDVPMLINKYLHKVNLIIFAFFFLSFPFLSVELP